MQKQQHRYFICEKCQRKLAGKPTYAKTMWVRMMNLGRHHADKQQWNIAVKAYGNALDVMDLLLDETDDSKNISKYIRTSLELIYAIRHSTYPNNLPLLVSLVKKRVDEYLIPANTQFIMQPVSAIAYKPLHEALQILTGNINNDRLYARTIC